MHHPKGVMLFEYSRKSKHDKIRNGAFEDIRMHAGMKQQLALWFGSEKVKFTGFQTLLLLLLKLLKFR